MNGNMKDFKKLCLSGIAGGVAGTIQMSSLYWLRTIIKYQYVHPYSLKKTFHTLTHGPDKLRLFRGFIPSVTKVALGKVGEASIIKHFTPNENDNNNKFKQSVYSSVAITGWKTLWMPFDTMGNCYQVNGKNGYHIIRNKIKVHGLSTLWSGTFAFLNISLVNNTIWIYMYHQLNQFLPKDMNQDIRNGTIGLGATFCSDLIVNPLRVMKTNIQSSPIKINYTEIYNNILKQKSGYFRGFNTKILFNCFNSALYVILWKRLDEIYT